MITAEILLLCISVAAVVVTAGSVGRTDSGKEIMALERDAMEHWCRGDVERYLEISADDVTYFDPSLDTRLNGLAELSKHYRSFAGQFHFDRFEFLNPQIELSGEFALLTYNLVSYVDSKIEYWNMTSVYRNKQGKWKIIHFHASPTKPKLAQG